MVFADPRFSPTARAAIEDAEIVHVSAVTAWELATKVRLGKWPAAERLSADLPKIVVELGLRSLPVTLAHAQAAASMAGAHSDPFDRMLAAQAIGENMGLVTVDPVFRDFAVRIVW